MAAKVLNGRIKGKVDTTAHWNAATGFIPLKGETIIYSDYDTAIPGVTLPGIKIGDGLAYVQDLPFLNYTKASEILAHLSDDDIHVTTSEKTFWSNKLNIETETVVGETLIFNRN